MLCAIYPQSEPNSDETDNMVPEVCTGTNQKSNTLSRDSPVTLAYQHPYNFISDSVFVGQANTLNYSHAFIHTLYYHDNNNNNNKRTQ